MPANVSVEYTQAEKEYFAAQTDEEKLVALEKMLSQVPGHKGAESLRANIRTRIKKLTEKIESKKQQRKKAGRKEGIKKEGIQVILTGLTQSGKSSLLALLTNARPLISDYPYTTKTETLGTLHYQGLSFQIIDMPAVNHETFDYGLANTADILLIVVTSISQLNQISPFINNRKGKKVIVFNKSDLLSREEKRKISAYLQSKKYNFILVSCKTKENIGELKLKLIESSEVIRIYTKQPGKQADETPIVMPQNSTVKDVAEKIFHGFSEKVKETRVTGPSGKFPNQKVSLSHTLKDKDIVEFRV